MSKFAGASLAVDTPFRVELLHPVTNTPLRDKDQNTAYVEVLSHDSQKARQHQRDVANRRLRRGAGKITAEEIEAENVDLMVALTAGWYLLDLEGNPLNVEFNEANARELYSTREVRWIRDQVDEAAAERKNFSKA